MCSEYYSIQHPAYSSSSIQHTAYHQSQNTMIGFRGIVDDIIMYDSDATQHANHAFSKSVQTDRLRLI